MTEYFVDTNLFIRYLTNDDADKADRVERLLREAAAGQTRLVTAEMVLAEVVWVLESSYGLKAPAVTPLIRAILATPGLEVINGSLVEQALVYYENRNIDFIDGYIVALMEKRGLTGLYSFDRKHIDRIPGIERKEP
jgi:predicted nucleic acid-binding protein